MGCASFNRMRREAAIKSQEVENGLQEEGQGNKEEVVKGTEGDVTTSSTQEDAGEGEAQEAQEAQEGKKRGRKPNVQ